MRCTPSALLIALLSLGACTDMPTGGRSLPPLAEPTATYFVPGYVGNPVPLEVASAMNASGAIVGRGGTPTVALHRAGTVLRTLASPGRAYTWYAAYDINAGGAIVGVARTAGGQPAAVYWASATATATIIPNTLGGVTSVAHAINDAGTVVGWATTAAGVRRAYRWTAGSGMVDLGAAPAGIHTEAYGISNTGWVTGYRIEGSTDAPFRTSPTGVSTTIKLDARTGAMSIADDGTAALTNAQLWTVAGALVSPFPGLSPLRRVSSQARGVGTVSRPLKTGGTIETAAVSHQGVLTLLTQPAAANSWAMDVDRCGNVLTLEQLVTGNFRSLLWLRTACDP